MKYAIVIATLLAVASAAQIKQTSAVMATVDAQSAAMLRDDGSSDTSTDDKKKNKEEEKKKREAARKVKRTE